MKLAHLYHAIGMDYVQRTLEKDRILGTAIQRFDRNGHPLPDPDFKHGTGFRHLFRQDPDTMIKDFPSVYQDFKRWEDSEWYCGVSLTRSREFALSWAGYGVVLVLDQQSIRQNHKVIPWNWGSSRHKYKKECEEFVVLGRTDRPTKSFNRGKLVRPTEGNPSIRNLNKHLRGILMSKDVKEMVLRSNSPIDHIIHHPRFHGWV